MRLTKKELFASVAIGALCLGICACGTTDKKDVSKETDKKVEVETVAPELATELNVVDDNYRNYYEVFVGSFYDSNGDGLGDIQGLISKLDYINDGDDTTDDDLGMNGLWLMPVNPSPTYHKYDVMDYYDIDSGYGTKEDFKQLVEECNKRGIKVIMDLVMNHSSDHHEWFLKASEYLESLAPGEEPDENVCPYVGYYTFSRTKESGNYYQVGNSDWYYNAQFSSNMPDLNWDNPKLKEEFENIAKYWIEEYGVGGFRLDAVKEYYSGNTPKNVEVLTWFSQYVKSIKPDAYIVGEAWSGDYYEYLASGIDSVFDFNYASFDGHLANIVQDNNKEYNGRYLADNLVYSLDTIKSKNPNGIMAPFYANHDLNRAAHYLAFKEDKIKMDAGLLSIMNGSPFYYYGDEIGLGGAGDDENKRSPMIWSTTDDTGKTRGPVNMQSAYVINKFGSVEEQLKDDSSILNYVKNAVKIRNMFPEMARGDVEIIDGVDEEIFAVRKTYEGSSIIVLANTSSADEKEVKLDRTENGYTNIKAILAVGDDEPYQTEDTIVMPPFSIVVLK